MKGKGSLIKDSKLKVKEELLKKYGFIERGNAWTYERHGHNHAFRKAELEDISFKEVKEVLNEITKRAISDS